MAREALVTGPQRLIICVDGGNSGQLQMQVGQEPPTTPLQQGRAPGVRPLARKDASRNRESPATLST
jgi:hypothetical protein